MRTGVFEQTPSVNNGNNYLKGGVCMAWYWWVLIIFGAIVIGYFKLKVFKGWMNKKSKDEDE